MKPIILIYIAFSFCLLVLCFAGDSDNIMDFCLTDKSKKQAIFINGLPCKNPTTATASDFKSSELNHFGDTDNFYRSSTAITTAGEFPGLNTLGLAIARSDLEVDGLILPHSHPRASEIFFLSKGVVIVGFIDSQNQLFQTQLKKGDVFVFPKGLLHYCMNNGFESAIGLSVFNSQNPGTVSIASAMFASDDVEAIEMLKGRLVSLSKLGVGRFENATSRVLGSKKLEF